MLPLNPAARARQMQQMHQVDIGGLEFGASISKQELESLKQQVAELRQVLQIQNIAAIGAAAVRAEEHAKAAKRWAPAAFRWKSKINDRNSFKVQKKLQKLLSNPNKNTRKSEKKPVL